MTVRGTRLPALAVAADGPVHVALDKALMFRPEMIATGGGRVPTGR
ncbi:MAG: hypothetical protein ACP5P1_15200 [Acidimicrobiales bacterium]